MLLTCLATTVTLAASPSQSEAQETSPPRVRNVAIVVYEGVELLDFAGPGETFSAVHGPHGMAFEVYTVARSTEPIVSQGFVNLTPAFSFETCPAPDIVVVPGGNAPISDLELRAFVTACSETSEVILSVCNGAGVLAAAGLLDGLEVTTHRSALEMVQTIAPTATVLTNRRFVDNGKIVTTAGVSAGIDGALHVVSRLHGIEAAQATARYMEYDWRPEEIAQLHAQAGERVAAGSARQLLTLVDGKSTEEALPGYQKLVQADASTYSEQRVNRLGYTLLNSGRGDDALRLLQLTAAAYPASANACDSLAEAYESLGHGEQAAHWSARALELLEADGTIDAQRVQLIRKASSERLERIGQGAARSAWVCPPCGGDCDAERYSEAGRCKNPGCGMELVKAEPEAAR